MNHVTSTTFRLLLPIILLVSKFHIFSRIFVPSFVSLQLYLFTLRDNTSIILSQLSMSWPSHSERYLSRTVTGNSPKTSIRQSSHNRIRRGQFRIPHSTSRVTRVNWRLFVLQVDTYEHYEKSLYPNLLTKIHLAPLTGFWYGCTYQLPWCLKPLDLPSLLSSFFRPLFDGLFLFKRNTTTRELFVSFPDNYLKYSSV